MYVPHFNAMDDSEEIRDIVESVGAAELVTVGADGYPVATLLPVIWDGDRVIMHMARANPHWRDIEAQTPGLAIVSAEQAYVSPSWYASKAEHGRVVPTWNYSAVHLAGRVSIHDDAEWLRDAVTRLTDTHEQRREDPWAVTDAPDTFIAKQMKAIVGVELVIDRVEGKAKLSQNRSADDFAGVIDGLDREGGARERRIADRMRALTDD